MREWSSARRRIPNTEWAVRMNVAAQRINGAFSVILLRHATKIEDGGGVGVTEQIGVFEFELDLFCFMDLWP